MALADKYVNPLTDFGFKKLFGTEPNKELVIDFLNQLLPEKHKIEDLVYSNNENIGLTQIDRKAIFDLHCRSNNGDRFIVEIQKAKQNFFKDRSVYYSTFPIQEQAKKGEWNYQLSAVYTVGILDFVFEEDKQGKEFIHRIQLKNQDCKVFYDKLTYIYLELPKFRKTESDLVDRFDKWIYLLKHLSELQDRPKKLQDRIFKKLFEAAEIANFSLEERQAYEDSLKYYRDLKNVVDTSREEGIEEGKIEGKIEGKMEVALALKNNNIPIDIIMNSTGLSKEEIDKL